MRPYWWPAGSSIRTTGRQRCGSRSSKTATGCTTARRTTAWATTPPGASSSSTNRRNRSRTLHVRERDGVLVRLHENGRRDSRPAAAGLLVDDRPVGAPDSQDLPPRVHVPDFCPWDRPGGGALHPLVGDIDEPVGLLDDNPIRAAGVRD